MGLPNPGSFEQLHREVRSVFVTNFLFDGAKFDFGKGLSDKFHVQHSFTMGSQTQPSAYNFGSVYVNEGVIISIYFSKII
jgi:mitochondrial import receptor subunit TOM40